MWMDRNNVHVSGVSLKYTQAWVQTHTTTTCYTVHLFYSHMRLCVHKMKLAWEATSF